MTATITRDELRAAIDSGSVTVVDALGGEYYAKQHLPSAILAEHIPDDRSTAIVTYCSNLACPNSEREAQRLIALGYTNVRKYAEGIEDWTGAGLPTESA